MKRTTALLACLLALATAGLARAQERIPTEQAQQIAKVLQTHSDKESNLPVKAEVDSDKPFGVRHEEFGAMAVPDKKLTAEVISKADKDVAPVGHFWMKKLKPVVDGKPAATDKLRNVSVDVDNNTINLTFYLLGVRKGEKGDPELVIYGSGKEPLAVRPLEKAEASQTYPIEIDGREDGDAGLLTLMIAGKYKTTLRVIPELD
ncbi:MAG: hypothetical protein U0800_08295 [Isosphaeraceae bacterium]